LKIEPNLQLRRFEQLSPGDLFIYFHDNGSCVALKAEDPTQNGEKLVALFGPIFPSFLNGPCLIQDAQANVISFGRDFILRLPSYAEGWSASEPTENVPCILKTKERFFLRANFSPRIAEFAPCYIDMSTGLINAETQRLRDCFTRPRGICAIAVEWELMTIEREPQRIFAQRRARNQLP
jgi:hypothetical protein